MRHVVEAMPTKFELGRRRNICSTTHCKHDVAIAAPNNANPASERIKENNKTQINIKPTYPFNCLEHFDPSCLRKSALPSLRIQFRNVITRQHTTKTILGRLRNSQLVDRLSKDFRQQRRPIIQWHRRSLPIILCSRFQIVLLFKRQHRHLTQQIQISAAVILRQIRSHFVDANRQPVIKIYIYICIYMSWPPNIRWFSYEHIHLAQGFPVCVWLQEGTLIYIRRLKIYLLVLHFSSSSITIP